MSIYYLPKLIQSSEHLHLWMLYRLYLRANTLLFLAQINHLLVAEFIAIVQKQRLGCAKFQIAPKNCKQVFFAYWQIFPHGHDCHIVLTLVPRLQQHYSRTVLTKLFKHHSFLDLVPDGSIYTALMNFSELLSNYWAG